MVETSEYKDMFIEEAREHLTTLNQALLDFEKDPKNKEALNQIFRAAHTLKGMSATMNYEKIQKLAHKTEDTLDLIRNNKLEVDSGVIDLIFKCFDGIEKMVEDIATNDMTEFDIIGLIEQLEKQMQQEDIAKPPKSFKPPNPPKPQGMKNEKLTLDNESEQKLIKEIQNGKLAYQIITSVVETCSMKSIRAFILLKKLADRGYLFYTKPEKSQIEDGKFDDSFEIIYVTDQQTEQVEKIMDSVAELQLKIVTPIFYENDVLHLYQSDKDKKPASIAPGPDIIQKSTVVEKKNQPIGQTKPVSVVQSIRIEMDKLDHFMNLIGELVISKGRLSQISKDYKLEDLTETIDTIDRLTTELQDNIMQVRMIPMKHIFDRFPRMIRDLARNNGKNVRLEIHGEGIELDRSILDEIGDPLVHLLRNSIDHGIENPEMRKKLGKPDEGIIELIAERTRNHVHIIVRDDGKGIDPQVMRDAAVKKGLKTSQEVKDLDDKEAINLMFLPGLSTAEKITNVSGRGVGMDVVKSTIEKLNGSIEITSEIGRGSEFLLRLPLTMAIFKSLFVGVADETYAIPIINVIETIHLNKTDIETIHTKKTTVLRDEVLPLVSLAELLGINTDYKENTSTLYSVIVQKEEKKFGLIVDNLIGEQEITIKNIGGTLKKTKGIAGVSIMGDGRVILVLDINTLINC
jgi:two-component system, chemotaxis family, sensor kinase CheA